MDIDYLERLRKSHPGWRLLAADHAPLVVAFLQRAFLAPNVRTLARAEAVTALEDLLFELRERLGAKAYPRAASAYLDEWSNDEHGWLRCYYPRGTDEQHYDLTPASEKSVEWVVSLRKRQFIGAESRLLTVLELLQQMARGTELDPAVRLARLQRERAEIDAEIQRVREGRIDLLDATQVKDRFLQMEETARALLGDFRELEDNFRELDRSVREQIATWDGSKGALLDDIFGRRDAISDSDQGRSFRAFWDFLMSPTRQEEFSAMLRTVLGLPAVAELAPDPRLARIHFDWLEAGEVAQRTVARLSEQLRRFLDDQAWLENRRIMELIRSVEQHAIAVRDQPPGSRAFHALDAMSPDLGLPFERPLYSPPRRPNLLDRVIVEGSEDVPLDALFDQVYVDRARLAENVERALQDQSQVSLGELLENHPVERGLAEVVAYLHLASEDRAAMIDEAREQRVVWIDGEGRGRSATLPLVIFTR